SLPLHSRSLPKSPIRTPQSPMPHPHAEILVSAPPHPHLQHFPTENLRDLPPEHLKPWPFPDFLDNPRSRWLPTLQRIYATPPPAAQTLARPRRPPPPAPPLAPDPQPHLRHPPLLPGLHPPRGRPPPPRPRPQHPPARRHRNRHVHRRQHPLDRGRARPPALP